MLTKSCVRFILLGSLLINLAMGGEVPGVTYQPPTVPGFLAPYYFETVSMQIFSPGVGSMQSGLYRDLLLNPALLNTLTQGRFYFDLYQTGTTPSSFYINPPVYAGGTDYSGNSYGSNTRQYSAPRWLVNTSRVDLDSKPIYSLAWLIPVTSKLHLGLFNRASLDYGSYLQSNMYYWGDYYGSIIEAGVGSNDVTPDPSTLSVDENQQHLTQVQSQIMMSYALNDKMTLGGQIQQNLYTREGHLNDSFREEHPHSDAANLDQDELSIRGTHHILGLGILMTPRPDLSWGISGKYGFGTTSDIHTMLDTSQTWNENPADVTYFSHNYFNSGRDDDVQQDGTVKAITLHGTKTISPELRIRAALTGNWKVSDVSATITARDTAFWDRVYDTYDNSSHSYFTQYDQYWSQHHYELTGDGSEKWKRWSGFIALEYDPSETWHSFTGIYFQQTHITQTLNEVKTLQGEFWFARSLHFTETGYDIHEYDKRHTFSQTATDWKVIIPLGAELQLTKNLSLSAGSELRFAFYDAEANARLLYNRIYDKRIRDGATQYEIEESDRYESYQDDPAFVFSRASVNVAGLTYQPTDHLRVEIGVHGNYLSPASWVIGFEWR